MPKVFINIYQLGQRRVCNIDKTHTHTLSQTYDKLIKATKLIIASFDLDNAEQTWLTAHNKLGTTLAKSCGSELV